MKKYSMSKKLKVLIITCWVVLIVCCVFKLFGANWFIASTNNQHFINFCNFLDTTKLVYSVAFIMNLFSCSIYYMSIFQLRKIQLKWFIPLTIYCALKVMFNQYDIVFMILDVFMTLIFPLFLNRYKRKSILLGFGLLILFLLISAFLKLDNYTMFDTNTVVCLILSVDYYVMLILYYLYSLTYIIYKNRKEKV